MSDWSNQGLPLPRPQGYVYAPDAGLVRTKMEDAATRQRRRYDVDVRQFVLTFDLTAAQAYNARLFMTLYGYDWFTIDLVSGDSMDGEPTSHTVRAMGGARETYTQWDTYEFQITVEDQGSNPAVPTGAHTNSALSYRYLDVGSRSSTYTLVKDGSWWGGHSGSFTCANGGTRSPMPIGGFHYVIRPGSSDVPPGATEVEAYNDTWVWGESRAIDLGRVTLDFSGYISSFAFDRSPAAYKVSFLDISLNELAAYTSEDVSTADCDWIPVTFSGLTVPVLTRLVRVTLVARASATYPDDPTFYSYFDNWGFSLSASEFDLEGATTDNLYLFSANAAGWSYDTAAWGYRRYDNTNCPASQSETKLPQPESGAGTLTCGLGINESPAGASYAVYTQGIPDADTVLVDQDLARVTVSAACVVDGLNTNQAGISLEFYGVPSVFTTGKLGDTVRSATIGQDTENLCQWAPLSLTEIRVPPGTRSMKLYLYAYGTTSDTTNISFSSMSIDLAKGTPDGLRLDSEADARNLQIILWEDTEGSEDNYEQTEDVWGDYSSLSCGDGGTVTPPSGNPFFLSPSTSSGTRKNAFAYRVIDVGQYAAQVALETVSVTMTANLCRSDSTRGDMRLMLVPIDDTGRVVRTPFRSSATDIGDCVTPGWGVYTINDVVLPAGTAAVMAFYEGIYTYQNTVTRGFFDAMKVTARAIPTNDQPEMIGLFNYQQDSQYGLRLFDLPSIPEPGPDGVEWRQVTEIALDDALDDVCPGKIVTARSNSVQFLASVAVTGGTDERPWLDFDLTPYAADIDRGFVTPFIKGFVQTGYSDGAPSRFYCKDMDAEDFWYAPEFSTDPGEDQISNAICLCQWGSDENEEYPFLRSGGTYGAYIQSGSRALRLYLPNRLGDGFRCPTMAIDDFSFGLIVADRLVSAAVPVTYPSQPAPVISIGLTVTPSPATFSGVGETITFVYEITNTGSKRVYTPINVTDSNAPGFNFVSEGGFYEGLYAGEHDSDRSFYTTTQADVDAGQIVSTSFANMRDIVGEEDGVVSNTVVVTVPMV